MPCNVTECGFDGGDCANVTTPAWWNTGVGGVGGAANNGNWGYFGNALEYCAVGCPDSWIGDRYWCVLRVCACMCAHCRSVTTFSSLNVFFFIFSPFHK